MYECATPVDAGVQGKIYLLLPALPCFLLSFWFLCSLAALKACWTTVPFPMLERTLRLLVLDTLVHGIQAVSG